MTDTTVAQCKGITRGGTQCRLKAGPTGFCATHQPAVAEVTPEADASRIEELEILTELGELGEEYTIQVCRMPGNVYLDRIQSSDLSLDHVKAQFGGGRFVLRPQKNGRFFSGGKTVEVRIEGTPKTIGEPATNGAGVAAVPVPESQMGAVLTAIATMMAPIMAAAVREPTPPPPGPSVTEIMDMGLRVADYSRENRTEPSPYGPVLEMARPLIERITGPQGPEPVGAPRSVGEVPRISPPGVSEPAPEPERDRTPEGYAHAIAAWLEPHRLKGGNPDLWAEVFIEETGAEEGGDAELLAWGAQAALHPEALDYWAAAVPVVGENREWYGLFLSGLRTLLEDADAPADDTGGGPGNVADAVAHEATGEGEPE